MNPTEGRRLRHIVLAVVVAGLVFPVIVGMAQVVAAAFGVMPAIGQGFAGFDHVRAVIGTPGFARSLWLTVGTGLGATLLSLLVAFLVLPALHERRAARMLAPFLAAPHAAIAIGLALVVAPSGWIAGAISPWLTGWDRPPAIVTVNDPFGLTLVLGLMLKEVPYLLFVMLAALSQLPLDQTLRTGEALGYSRRDTWFWLVVPQLYPLVRLSVYVVLSFSMSVVDVAMVLGPSTPGSLSQMLTRWFLQPEVSQMLPAAAAAVLLALVILAALLAWRAGERIAGAIYRAALARRRIETGLAFGCLQGLSFALVLGLAALAALSAIAMVLWSLTWRWSFPGALPDSWSLNAWRMGIGDWGRTAMTTALLAGLSSALSLLLALSWLEAEYRGATPRARWAEALIYLPLLLPQIVLMPGLYALMLWAGLRPGFGPVLWAHTFFVFPYVMLALSDPWRRFDVRLLYAAASLGAGPFRQFATVRLPALAPSVMTAVAIGFTVSVALYVPTLFAGAGRVTTLTTEAVALSSGSDRRVTAVYAVLQMLLPLAVFLLALSTVRKPAVEAPWSGRGTAG